MIAIYSSGFDRFDHCVVWVEASRGRVEVGFDPPTRPVWPGFTREALPLLNTDLTLKTGSPAIDTGCGTAVTPADMLGNSRWDMAGVTNVTNGDGVDMGAHEYQGATGTDAIVTSFHCTPP